MLSYCLNETNYLALLLANENNVSFVVKDRGEIIFSKILTKRSYVGFTKISSCERLRLYSPKPVPVIV